MTMKKPTTKKAQTTEGKVYIGPTLGGGALMRNAVFRAGEFPPHIVSMREKSEALRGLFVPVSELATARKRIGVRERQKFCVHGIIGARQTGASNEHEHQTQFS